MKPTKKVSMIKIQTKKNNPPANIGKVSNPIVILLSFHFYTGSGIEIKVLTYIN
jgi:hypothetical protein